MLVFLLKFSVMRHLQLTLEHKHHKKCELNTTYSKYTTI